MIIDFEVLKTEKLKKDYFKEKFAIKDFVKFIAYEYNAKELLVYGMLRQFNDTENFKEQLKEMLNDLEFLRDG